MDVICTDLEHSRYRLGLGFVIIDVFFLKNYKVVMQKIKAKSYFYNCTKALLWSPVVAIFHGVSVFNSLHCCQRVVQLITIHDGIKP